MTGFNKRSSKDTQTHPNSSRVLGSTKEAIKKTKKEKKKKTSYFDSVAIVGQILCAIHISCFSFDEEFIKKRAATIFMSTIRVKCVKRFVLQHTLNLNQFQRHNRPMLIIIHYHSYLN